VPQQKARSQGGLFVIQLLYSDLRRQKKGSYSSGFAAAALRLMPNLFQRLPVSVDRNDSEGVCRNDHHDTVQPFDARLDTTVALNFSLTDEVEPDACAMLEDTIPANELQVAVADVALRAAVFTMLGPGCLGLVFSHCSSLRRLGLNVASQTEQLNMG
jgi:hypothetical protein